MTLGLVASGRVVRTRPVDQMQGGGDDLTIGVKAKLAGTILSQLGEVPANAEKVGAALAAINELTFNGRADWAKFVFFEQHC